MDLSISFTIEDQMVFITTVGELDVYTAPKLRGLLADLIKDATRRLYVINLSDVDYIDSTGLGVIVGALKRARSRRSDVVLVVASERLHKVFRCTGLVQVFAIYPSEDDARSENEWANWDVTSDVILDQDDVVIGFPIYMYVQEWNIYRELMDQMDELVTAFGMEIIYISTPLMRGRELGVRAKTGSHAALASATEQSARLRSAIAGQPVILSKDEHRMVTRFHATLQQSRGSVIQISSFMLVKFEEEMEVRNLTQRELRYWFYNENHKNNPEVAMRLLRSPPGLL